MNYKKLLAKLMQKKYKQIVAVDISSSVKTAVIKCREGKPVVTALYLDEVPLELEESGLDTAMAGFVCGLLKKHGLNSGALVFTVGAANSALLTLQLPKMSENELHEAARWELAQELGSEPDSFCYAAAYLQKLQEGLNQVIAAVIPQHIADVFAGAAEQAGLTLCGVYLRPQAVQQTFVKGCCDFLLFDVSDGSITLSAFINALPVAQKEFNSELDIETLAAEIDILQFANADTEFKQLIINGEADKNLQAALQERLNLTITVNDITHSVGFSEGLDAECVKQLNSFAAAIGAALCFVNGEVLNLMPHKQNALSLPKWQVYRAAAIGLAVCCLALWGWQLAQLYSVQSEVKAVQQQIAAMGEWQERYDEAAMQNAQINKRLRLAERLKTNEINWNAALADISETMPNGCWLEKAETGSKAGQIKISGSAVDMDKAVDFADRLAKHKNSAHTELTELKTVQADGRTLAAFSLLWERR